MVFNDYFFSFLAYIDRGILLILLLSLSLSVSNIFGNRGLTGAETLGCMGQEGLGGGGTG